MAIVQRQHPNPYRTVSAICVGALLPLGIIAAASLGSTHFRRASENKVARAAVFSASQGAIVPAQAPIVVGSQLVWFDRTGKRLSVLGNPAFYFDLELSPDGKHASVSVPDRSDPTFYARDIWIYDVARGLRTRFTFGPALARTSIWSPDGNEIVFASGRQGPGRMDLYRKASSGAGNEELLLEDNTQKFPDSWSPDGKFIIYISADSASNGTQLYVLPLSGDNRKPFPFLHTQFNQTQGQFSPDGRWVAYLSDESGTDELYVSPFPGPGNKKQVSMGGANQPRWSRDGSEIFFFAPDNNLMAAAVNGKGGSFEVDSVKPLFQTRTFGPPWEYEVSPDGQRFLINILPEESPQIPGTVTARVADQPAPFEREASLRR